MNQLNRIARAGPRSEPKTYETVSFDGCFRRADSAPRGCRPTNYPMEVQMLRRGRTGRDDLIPLHSISGNDIVSFSQLIEYELFMNLTQYIRFVGTHCCR